jgi:DNA-binding NarL/FixJ family response regulator
LHSGPARVLIAADSPALRADLRHALDCDGRFACAESEDAAAAIAASLSGEVEVCVIAFLDHARRVATVASIATGAPWTTLLVYAPQLSGPELVAALRAGASGYFPAAMSTAALPDLLAALLAGEAFLPGDSLAAVLGALRSEWERAARRSGRDSRLTPREWEVLELLAEDLTTIEIAQQLGVAEVTVRSHVASMLKKLELRTRQAALRAYRTRSGVFAVWGTGR